MACHPEKIGKIILLLFALSLCTAFSPAYAEVAVDLRLDRSEATLADTVKIVVSVSGTRKVQSPPVLSNMDFFSLTRGGTSSRMEIVNGRVNAAVEYVYFLRPKQTGTFKIGPAEVKVGGKTYQSKKAILSVTKPDPSAGADRGPFFLTARLSSKGIYVEGQAIYMLKLYYRTNVSNVSLELPEIDHIKFTQLAKPVDYQGAYKGKIYQILEVRYAMVPSKAGTYAIGPSRMNMTVALSRNRSSNSFLDDPFFSLSPGRPIEIVSETLDLEVMRLPEEGRPADFSGLVGSFEIESNIEPSSMKAGDSATLTVVVKGKGNISRIPDLKIPESDNTKVYADQPVLNPELNSNGLGGTKIMKWALVPEKEGDLEIPPIRLSFFDVETRKYRELKTRPYVLSVLPGKEAQIQKSKTKIAESGTRGSRKQAITELGRDILPVHASMNDFKSSGTISPQGFIFWIVLMIPFAFYTATFCFIKLRAQSSKTFSVTKAKKAAAKFLKQYRQCNQSSAELGLLIRAYLNDRFHLSHGSITPKEAAEILRSNGAVPDTAQRMSTLLQGLEDAVYTGKGTECYGLNIDVQVLIKEIEREIG